MSRIALVACNKNAAKFKDDPSFIYRCVNLAAGLKQHGNDVLVCHISQLPWLRDFDVIVFHRPRATLRFKLLMAKLRRSKSILIADFDDLIMDPDFVDYSPGVLNGMVSIAATRHLFKQHFHALPYFEAFTVSTTPLAAHLQRLRTDANVGVIANGVYHDWEGKALLHKDPAKRSGTAKEWTISYNPGTPSHDRDFASVAPALERFLASHPQSRLVVTGPLSFQLPAQPHQIVRREKVPFDRFHEYVRSADVNLAPLEATPFTRCKSALKVLETGFWNIPTICSRFPDAERFIDAGALIADNEQAWFDHLVNLYEDEAFYGDCVHQLRARVLEKGNVASLSAQWLGYVAQTRLGA